MSSDRLTLPNHQLAHLVETVLAGSATESVAVHAGIDPVDFHDAVETYRAGGRAALEARQDSEWFNARIRPVEWATAEAAFVNVVGPSLDQLGHPWWFLRKHPYWRIRLRTLNQKPAMALLDGLVADGVIACWASGIYEPETAAFGGSLAMANVHDLHCADSRGVLAYARLGQPPMGRRELSLLLIRAMQDHANLDWFEAAGVFDRLAQIRPDPGPGHQSQIDALAEQMLPILALRSDVRGALFAPDGPLHAAADWIAAFEAVGHQLGNAATSGRLGRGLRAVLAQVTIFHWNRLGMSAQTQGVLARAAATALLPRR